jgi:hypothetical protein
MWWSLALVATALAEEPPEIQVDLADGPKGFGVGIALGEPSGLSLALRPDRMRAIQAHASWSLLEDRFRFGADYLQHLGVFKPAETPGVHFPVYVGLGLTVGVDDHVWIGPRVPIGIAVLPTEVPIDAFLEIAPTLWVLPEVRPDLEGSIGARVFF